MKDDAIFIEEVAPVRADRAAVVQIHLARLENFNFSRRSKSFTFLFQGKRSHLWQVQISIWDHDKAKVDTEEEEDRLKGDVEDDHLRLVQQTHRDVNPVHVVDKHKNININNKINHLTTTSTLTTRRTIFALSNKPIAMSTLYM